MITTTDCRLPVGFLKEHRAPNGLLPCLFLFVCLSAIGYRLINRRPTGSTMDGLILIRPDGLILIRLEITLFGQLSVIGAQ